MSKSSKRRRDAKASKRTGTTLGQHQRQKSRLVPPFNQMPTQMTPSNWMQDRMPEVLWACLVRAVLPRNEALDVFREVAAIAREFADSPASPAALLPTHSNLAAHYPQLIPRIVQIVVQKPLGFAALRPLVAIESLPARDQWVAATGVEPDPMELDALADTVLEFIDHQSEFSTDVRWLLVLYVGLAGKLKFPRSMAHRIDELIGFPNTGDLRSVRPFIRATEIALWTMQSGHTPVYPWSEKFWKEYHERTPCIAGEPESSEAPKPSPQELRPVVIDAITKLSEHWFRTSSTTAIDAKHEATFAFVLYALICLYEMLGSNRTRITGRLLLRTLTECRITLAYLQRKNDTDLWAKFRKYGAGQAKLALLKLNEAKRPPHSVSVATLELLANEDMWEELVDIDLGHWAGADLRKMAEDSGTKDVYDAHYGWTSGFAHGHWSAMRDTTLTTCLNPLHRLHRIPSHRGRVHGDVVPDGIELVETMIEDLLREYPGTEITLRPDGVPAPDADAEASGPTAPPGPGESGSI